jgi:hypothetical protein
MMDGQQNLQRLPVVTNLDGPAPDPVAFEIVHEVPKSA